MNYKSLFLLVTFLMAALISPAQNDWENPKVFQINKMEPHACFYGFINEKKTLKNNWKNSEYYELLNGTWKFNWVKKPSDRPVDFYKESYDVSGWKDIKVPGNWEIEGVRTGNNFGIPIYVNTTYPWSDKRPRKVVVLMDTTYWGNNFGVMLFNPNNSLKGCKNGCKVLYLK